MRAQQLALPGVRTRIRSGALPPTAGRPVRDENDSAAAPAVVQVANVKALASIYSIHTSAAAAAPAQEAAPTGRQSARVASAAQVQAARAAVASSDKAEPAAAGAGPAKAPEQREPAAVTALTGARARVSRFGRLLKSSHVAADAAKGQLPAAAQQPPFSTPAAADDAPDAQPSSADAEPAELSVLTHDSTASKAVQARAAEGGESAGHVDGNAKLSAASAVAAQNEVSAAAAPRGRKRPSPKKAPSGLGFRTRRAPKLELFSKDGPLKATTTGKAPQSVEQILLTCAIA